MGEFMGVLIDFEDRIGGIYDNRYESGLIIEKKMTNWRKLKRVILREDLMITRLINVIVH